MAPVSVVSFFDCEPVEIMNHRHHQLLMFEGLLENIQGRLEFCRRLVNGLETFSPNGPKKERSNAKLLSLLTLGTDAEEI